MQCLGAPSGRAAYKIPAERVMAVATEINSSQVDANPDPGHRHRDVPIRGSTRSSARKAGDLGQSGHPVDVLRLAGSDLKPSGFGRLLAGGALTSVYRGY